jgi:hypothetical protein
MSDQITEAAAGSGYAGPACSAVLAEIVAEVERATRKFPTWPTDAIHAAAVVAEEVGELQKSVLEAIYEPHKGSRASVRTEAVQAAAMCLRFLASLDLYAWSATPAQHQQNARSHVPSDSEVT